MSIIKFPKFGLEKVTRSHVISYVASLPALKMKFTEKWVIILLGFRNSFQKTLQE